MIRQPQLHLQFISYWVVITKKSAEIFEKLEMFIRENPEYYVRRALPLFFIDKEKEAIEYVHLFIGNEPPLILIKSERKLLEGVFEDDEKIPGLKAALKIIDDYIVTLSKK